MSTELFYKDSWYWLCCSYYQDAVNPVSRKGKGHILGTESQRKSRGWRCMILWLLCSWTDEFLWLFVKFCVCFKFFTYLFFCFVRTLITNNVYLNRLTHLSPRVNKNFRHFLIFPKKIIAKVCQKLLECCRMSCCETYLLLGLVLCASFPTELIRECRLLQTVSDSVCWDNLLVCKRMLCNSIAV